MGSDEETTWVIPVRLQLGCPDDARTGYYRRRRACRLSARRLIAPAWFCRAHCAGQRRGPFAVPAATLVEGLSEGHRWARKPDVPAGQILLRPEYRLDFRSRRVD